MSEISITNVVDVSVSDTPTGVNAFNTSNLVLFSTGTPGDGFGDDGYKIYKTPSAVATDFGSSSITAKMATAVFSQAPNILAGDGYLVVIPFLPSETLDEAITRTKSLVQYFGVMSTQIESQADMLAAAAVIQAVNKVAAFVQRASGSIDPGGSLDLLRSGSLTKSRGLYYGSSTDEPALLFQAAYLGRALSTNFAGSRTTQTMHLKSLAGIQPDTSMDETKLEKAKSAGADTYPSIEGVPAIFDVGSNKFFDQVYNLGWFVSSIQVNGFNFLRQTSNKIAQTEQGVSGLKNAYRQSCEQAKKNQYCAPGEWTSPDTFGNLDDFLQNIREQGYYIYASPLSSQSQADREARKAPLVQIALKEAGALHSSNVIVNVNA